MPHSSGTVRRRPGAIALAAIIAALVAQAASLHKIAFARVFPNPGQLQIFVAAADGSDERPLPVASDLDYDPAWSPDGSSIVFTSERDGSADLFRIDVDGTNLERLTDTPAYDDQAAFAPDGKRLVFVSTRGGGTANLWTLDLQTRRVATVTSGTSGDFRPSWSPDGEWIAFSSGRNSERPFARGRWERLQLADIYIVRPDGAGLKRVSEHGDFCGSPKWTGDSAHVLAYCMTAEQTLANRRPSPDPGSETRLVSIDITTGTSTDVPAGGGVKINPSPLGGNDVGYVRKDGADGGAGIYYSTGRRGPRGDVRTASWSPDGTRVVFHRRISAPLSPMRRTFSRNPEYELSLTGGHLPSFNAAGDRFVTETRPSANPLGASLMVTAVGSERADVIYHDDRRNVLAAQWLARGDRIIFSVGGFNAFFNGFHGLFLEPGDRAEGGAQLAIINADGSGFHEVTSGPNNNAFPSPSPDGRRVVFRTFGPEGDGLRIMNLETRAVTPLTHAYDNFPLWSPRGDLIMFSRQAEGAYEIYTIRSDGSSPTRLTFTRGNDAHMAWSPDGEYIAFASSRMGFKDEVVYTDAPQPYGELFVMRFDGTRVQQLTDNQWEDGTPAWQPTSSRRVSRR
jgi:Tol biopolymer transport system component